MEHLVNHDAAEAPTSAPPVRSVRTTLGLIAVRVLTALAVLWAAVSITFVAIQIMPGDTVSVLLGENRDDPDLRQRTIERWGLDQPVWAQYLTYLVRIPTGDFGISYDLRKPVAELIGDALVPTLQLAGAAGVGAVVVAYAITLATSGRLRVIRPVSNVIELVLLSAPPFWIGIVALMVFSFQLGWFSIVRADSWQALVLPAASMAVPIGCYLAQILRDGVDRAVEQPFAVTARARGLSQFGVLRRHALRHGSVPMVTVLGLIVGSLIGGAVIMEQVYGRAGLGLLAVNAVTVKDIPLILGVTLVATAAFVVASTLVDVLALAIDPRLRARAAEGA